MSNPTYDPKTHPSPCACCEWRLTVELPALRSALSSSEARRKELQQFCFICQDPCKLGEDQAYVHFLRFKAESEARVKELEVEAKRNHRECHDRLLMEKKKADIALASSEARRVEAERKKYWCSYHAEWHTLDQAEFCLKMLPPAPIAALSSNLGEARKLIEQMVSEVGADTKDPGVWGKARLFLSSLSSGSEKKDGSCDSFGHRESCAVYKGKVCDDPPTKPATKWPWGDEDPGACPGCGSLNACQGECQDRPTKPEEK